MRNTAGWPVEHALTPPEGPDRASRITQRYADLCADLEMVSEALQDPPCLEYRTARDGCRAVRTGAATLRMLMDASDDGEVCRVLREHVRNELRERAETEIDDEASEREEADWSLSAEQSSVDWPALARPLNPVRTDTGD